MSQNLNGLGQVLRSNGSALALGELDDISVIRRWLSAINKSQNQSETRTKFINFFNPDTTGSNCYKALDEYRSIKRLPDYFYFLQAPK